MSDLSISAEELQIFNEFYRRRLTEAANGTVLDDEAELEIARDILQAVQNGGLTPDADGGESYVRRGAMDWTDPATLQAVKATSAGGSSRPLRRDRNRRSDMWQGMLIIGVALLAGVWFLWPSGHDEAEPGETVEPIALAAENTEITPTPLPTLEAALLADIVDASGVKTTLVVPRTLEIRGVSFVVQPVKIRTGDWPQPDDERAVSWIYGTVINYVMGLEATPANKALLASLQSGDELVLRMSTGPAYRFAYIGMVRVSPQASELFRQTRPGLTLALLGDSDQATRVVIQAGYIPDSDLGLRAVTAQNSAPVGQTLNLDNVVRLTCLDGEFLTVPSPPGYVYVRVNFRVENIGSSELSTGSFNHQLRWGDLSHGPVSSDPDWQTYPALPDTLLPGQQAATTAIYAIPESTVGPSPAYWEFAVIPGDPLVSIALPLATKPAAEVAIKQAERGDNGDLQLIVEVKPGNRPALIKAADIDLQGANLNPTANTWPWQVPTGERQQFRLVLTPDGAGRLTVTILEQSFEVTY